MTRRVVVHGASGRMGRAVIGKVLENPALKLVGAIARPGSPHVGGDAGMIAGGSLTGITLTDEVRQLTPRTDVVIDFSTAAACAAVAELCAEQAVALVSGTTGLNEEQTERVRRAAQRIPIVWAPNFGIGVNVLFHLASQAAKLLGDDFDAEIIELHHRNKVDAPSGTASRLFDVVAAAKQQSNGNMCTGRVGQVGARPTQEIGVFAVRAGDIVGDHTLLLAGPSERLELTHRAHDRGLFAAGAVRAAAWVQGKPPGIFGMTNVLGLE